MKMRLPEGKKKVLTLSYDDGVFQDERLLEIMKKYGIKGTFNLNHGRWMDESEERTEGVDRLKLSEAKKLYTSYDCEIAIHGYKHRFLNDLTPSQIVHEIAEDRKGLEGEFGIIAGGMAYAYGAYNKKVEEVLAECGVLYARTVKATCEFGFPENWLEWHPTCHHNCEKLTELAEKFVQVPNRHGRAELFYLWGHSYEFDRNDNWQVIEDFCKYMGNRDEIWYAANGEIYDYVTAYRSLRISYDEKIIYNPSAVTLWFEKDQKLYSIKSGETLNLA